MARPSLSENRKTKEDIIALGQELVQTMGFNELSYQDISDRLNIKKATIHYYFPTKDDLGVALAENYKVRLETWMSQFPHHLSVKNKLGKYMEFFVKLSGDGSKVCPCGAFAGDWNSLNPKVQDKVKEVLDVHRAFLKQLLSEIDEENGHKSRRSMEERVQFIFSSVQGAMQISRLQGNPNHLKTSLAQLADVLLSGEG